jgi:hypothetical protein
MVLKKDFRSKVLKNKRKEAEKKRILEKKK